MLVIVDHCWLILTLSRSSVEVKVKVVGQSSRSQDEKWLLPVLSSWLHRNRGKVGLSVV